PEWRASEANPSAPQRGAPTDLLLPKQQIHAGSNRYSRSVSVTGVSRDWAERFSCAQPRASESTNHPAATGSEQSAIAPSFSPNACRVSKIQPDNASEPRWITTSTRFFALYFSSRVTTVNSKWRAGFAIAKFIHRLNTWPLMTTMSLGIPARTAKPTI